jgi:hypothetical protein
LGFARFAGVERLLAPLTPVDFFFVTILRFPLEPAFQSRDRVNRHPVPCKV